MEFFLNTKGTKNLHKDHKVFLSRKKEDAGKFMVSFRLDTNASLDKLTNAYDAGGNYHSWLGAGLLMVYAGLFAFSWGGVFCPWDNFVSPVIGISDITQAKPPFE